MNTKICKCCGWEVAIDRPGNTCPVCHTKYDIVVCRVCGKIVTGNDKVPGRPLCKACHNAEERLHMKTYTIKHLAELDARYTNWMALIKQVPSTYPSLTEEQWLDACTYFDGCARCHSKEIDSRGFFIGFEVGGRYCDWNVIPLCEKCAKVWPLAKNPFIISERRDRTLRNNYEYRSNLENIVKYLGGKLNAAIQYVSVP